MLTPKLFLSKNRYGQYYADDEGNQFLCPSAFRNVFRFCDTLPLQIQIEVLSVKPEDLNKYIEFVIPNSMYPAAKEFMLAKGFESGNSVYVRLNYKA